MSHHNCAQECLVVMFKEFEVYCNKLIIAEGQGGGTSISRSTGQKIKEVLSGSQSAQEVPKKFRHFVKTHQFQIIEDTLCVPAKSREVRNHACHAKLFKFRGLARLVLFTISIIGHHACSDAVFLKPMSELANV